MGAVLGDSLGYWIGYYGGWPLLTRVGRLFRVPESQLLRVRERFAENAAQAVFLGRFIALLRIFAGPLAGIARMPYLKFLLCNVAGATVWATVMVSISYFVGRLVPLEQLIAWAAQFAFLALGLMVAWLGLTYWLEHRSFSKPKGQEPS